MFRGLGEVPRGGGFAGSSSKSDAWVENQRMDRNCRAYCGAKRLYKRVLSTLRASEKGEVSTAFVSVSPLPGIGHLFSVQGAFGKRHTKFKGFETSSMLPGKTANMRVGSCLGVRLEQKSGNVSPRAMGVGSRAIPECGHWLQGLRMAIMSRWQASCLPFSVDRARASISSKKGRRAALPSLRFVSKGG